MGNFPNPPEYTTRVKKINAVGPAQRFVRIQRDIAHFRPHHTVIGSAQMPIGREMGDRL
jgi:hypothetical protein